jgi:two-component system sensor histidine kinase HydH
MGARVPRLAVFMAASVLYAGIDPAPRPAPGHPRTGMATRTLRRTTEFPLEAGFRALMDDAESGVLLLDAEHRVADANPAALKLLGITRERARAAGASALLRTGVAGEDLARDVFAASRLEREAVLHTPGAGDVPVLLAATRIGRPPWVLVSLRDLTSMRRMQQELRRHERLATLGQLSAGVAHEIRNPLAGIGTSAQVLLKRFDAGDDRARFVQVILDEVARLDRIVTSLLQYARPRQPELKAVRLADCVARVVAMSRANAERQGVTLESEVAPRLAPVYVDADLVHQVLLNVSLNALQAMPSGGTLRYEVRLVRGRRPPRGPGRRSDDRLEIAERRNGGAAAGGAGPRRDPVWLEVQQVRVIDTGVGIPRGTRAKLFDPFFTTRPSGTGLGLSISQTIMQEHGGSIAVDSKEGRGTTVLLNFPLEKRNGERRQLDAGPVEGNVARRR